MIASAVVDDAGTRRVPTWLAPPDTPTATFLSTAKTVVTPVEKRRRAESSGADVVDLETAAIAMIAEDAGWTWTAIRAISDDVETTLPARIDTWVGDDGRTRPWPVFRDLVAHPRQLATIWRLGRASRRGLEAAAALVERLLTNPP